MNKPKYMMEKTRDHLKLIILLGISGINRKCQDLNETKPQISAIYKRGEYKGNKGNSSKRSCQRKVSGAQQEAPEKVGMLSLQACLSKGKDVEPVLPPRKLGIGVLQAQAAAISFQ